MYYGTHPTSATSAKNTVLDNDKDNLGTLFPASHFSIVVESALTAAPLLNIRHANIVTPNAITSVINIGSSIHRQATIFVTFELISSRLSSPASGRSSTALNHVSGVHLNSW
jgi:hypothetical protein